MTDNTTIFGTDLATIVDADGNPTRDAAVLLREVFEILTDATKAFNTAKRNLLAGSLANGADGDNPVTRVTDGAGQITLYAQP